MATLFKGHQRVCGECGTPFRAARSDATLCSGKCRMRLLRRAAVPKMGSLKAMAADLPPAFRDPVTDTACRGRRDSQPVTAAGPAQIAPAPNHPSRKPPAKKPPKLEPSAVQQLKAARAKGKKVVKISTKPKGRAK